MKKISIAVLLLVLVVSQSARAQTLSAELRQSLLQQLSALLTQVLTLQEQVRKLTQTQSIIVPIAQTNSTTSSRSNSAQAVALPLLEGFSLPPPPPRSSTLKILSVSPQSGEAGSTVTLTGTGFSSSMMLYAGYHSQSISSLDGKTVSFNIAPNMKFSSPEAPRVTETVSIYLEDASGISNAAYFLLSL